MSAFPSVAHVAVTVRDLDRSAAWYGRLFGAEPVLDEDTGSFQHKVYALGGTLFGLHAHPTAPGDGAFTATETGLDHVAFGVADRAALAEWAGTLDELGIEHGGIVDAHYGSGVSFKDPDGIALEFFAPPG